MKQKFLFLMFATIVLWPTVSASGYNLICNPSFEIDDDADGVPDGWGIWTSATPSWGGPDQTFVNDPCEARSGDWSVKLLSGIWGSSCRMIPGYSHPFCEPTINPHTIYYVGGFAKDIRPEYDGQESTHFPDCEVEYFNAAGDKVGNNEVGDPLRHFLFYLHPPDGTPPTNPGFLDTPFPRDGEYHLFYGFTQLPEVLNDDYVTPGPVTHVSAACYSHGPEGANYYIFDDMYIGSSLFRPVYDPEPTDNANGVSTNTQILSWKRAPYPCQRQRKCEVWWSTQGDPNFWIIPGASKKIMELSDVNFVNLSTIPPELGGPISLEPEEEYFWSVKYEDPNGCYWGAGLVYDICQLWSFKTSPASDINSSGCVDLVDFAILGSQWQDVPGSPSADIAPAVRDNFVGIDDLRALAENWLWEQ